jgi:hypothetical protein
MKKLLSLLLAFVPGILFCQDLRTYYGDRLYPVDTLRILNFFINIHYDLCDTCDPCRTETTTNWLPGPPNTVNQGLPVYLDDFMDSEYNPANIHGKFTKRLAEASFNKFIVLGDHVVVNIRQSSVNPTGEGFNEVRLLDSCISLINQNGGLNAKNGHDSITDYDGCYTKVEKKFRTKPQNFFNNKIDFIQVYFRNCTEKFGNLDAGGYASIIMKKPIRMGNRLFYNDAGTVQGAIKNTNLGYPESMPPDIHELAHNLLGMDNSIHMGGGGPLNSGDLITLEANAGGWSLMGSSGSSLLSCNAFERWRLNWRGPTNNNYPIAC